MLLQKTILYSYRVAVDAFRRFLQLTKSEDILDTLEKEECWEKFENVDEYHEAINVLTK